mgnify:FL=1
MMSFPFLRLHSKISLSFKNESGDDSKEDVDLYETAETTCHFPNKQDLDDLVRDLDLTKSNAELLTSRLRGEPGRQEL